MGRATCSSDTLYNLKFLQQHEVCKCQHLTNKEDQMGGACGMYGKEEKHTQVLVGKTEGKRTTGRSRHR